MTLDPKTYAWLSAREIASGVREKKFSAEDVTQAALKRAHELNPKLNAFVTILDDLAIQRAKALDQRLAAGASVGKLAGVPIGLKDNLCLNGVRTTCSSKILENFVPPYTATAVERVLAEDAIPLGKTNLDEFAMGSSTENSAFGTTLNPWDLERVPGGSSGGSSVCVAAGIAPLALGSDTGGSIRQPASFTGAFGLKPTYGRVSRYGLVAFASSLDQIGPFARNAEDAALLLRVLSGHDPKDGTSSEQPVPSGLEGVEVEQDLKGICLGVPKEYFASGLDAEVEAAVRAGIETFRKMGAEVVEVSLPHTEFAVAVYYIVATAEASSNLARFDGVHFGHRTKEDVGLVEMYARSRAEGLGDEVKRRIMLGTYALSSGYYDAYYLKAQKVRALIKGDFDRAFEKVDALICPTSPTTAFRLGEKASDPLSMYLSDIYTISANLATIPALSMPCGWSDAKLPIGLQLMGKAFGEEALLKLAVSFQAATDFHNRTCSL